MEKDSGKLVLLHAIGNDKDCWQFLELGELGIRDVGVYEMPGHGKKPRQPGMTWASMADEVVRQFDGPLHLVSVAAAGAIAASILVRYPERVLSAVIVCGGGVGTTVPSPEQRQMTIERGEAAVKNGMASIIDETFLRWFSADARLRDVPGVQYARRTLLAMDPQGWMDVQLAGLLGQPTPPQRIAQITQPVTLVGVFHDLGQGVVTAGQLHAAIANSRVQYVAGPHMLHLERPRNLLSAIEQHFIWLHIGTGRIETPLYFCGE